MFRERERERLSSKNLKSSETNDLSINKNNLQLDYLNYVVFSIKLKEREKPITLYFTYYIVFKYNITILIF